MRLLSLNRALPQKIEWQGRSIITAIFKKPTTETLAVKAEGLQGDGQADLSVHGGIDKAIYAFPHEHYPFFANLLKRKLTGFSFGQFGENLSTEGLLESKVMIGDRFRIGDTAEFEVSQPREPCFKLGIILQDPQILRPFLQSLKTGFYLRITKNGNIQAGDVIQQIHNAENSLSVADITRLRYFDTDHHQDRQKAASLPALSQSWRNDFSQKR